ncbi:hypothetical protein BKI52_03275 [marine bacterium AO1-C]|nr:hypothetical protein BKI52_03275 [marine bacterium AO1-C]
MKKFKKLSRADQRNIRGGQLTYCKRGACVDRFQLLGTDQCLAPVGFGGEECFGRLVDGLCCLY